MPGTDPKAYAIFKDGHRIAGAELASAFETETAVDPDNYKPEIDPKAIITPKLTSGESSTSLWSKVAKLFKNVRWLNAKYGEVIIRKGDSTNKVIGDGTVSGTIGAIQDQMETISYTQYKAMKDAGTLAPNRYYFVEGGPDDDRSASSIKYSNAGTSLTATNVQTAINELNNKLAGGKINITVTGFEDNSNVHAYKSGNICVVTGYGVAKETALNITGLPTSAHNAYTTIGSNPAATMSLYIGKNNNSISRGSLIVGNTYWFDLSYYIA